MKKWFIAVALITGVAQLQAQDPFQKELFSVDLVMNSASEIDLTLDQQKEIEKVYAEHIDVFNEEKWALDIQMKELEQALKESKIDEKKAELLLKKITQREEVLKLQKLRMLIRVKNLLTEDQQGKLRKLQSEETNNMNIITPINKHPRVMLRMDNPGFNDSPLFVLRTPKGDKHITQEELRAINPSDIESLEVIKGKAAREKFGKKGKNGVVVIQKKNKKK